MLGISLRVGWSSAAADEHGARVFFAASLTQLTLMALARFLRLACCWRTAGGHDAWCCVCGVLPQHWHN
jgi:hypothetical protein